MKLWLNCDSRAQFERNEVLIFTKNILNNFCPIDRYLNELYVQKNFIEKVHIPNLIKYKQSLLKL